MYLHPHVAVERNWRALLNLTRALELIVRANKIRYAIATTGNRYRRCRRGDATATIVNVYRRCIRSRAHTTEIPTHVGALTGNAATRN